MKNIGVSNCSIKCLKELLPECKIRPAVNQVEVCPPGLPAVCLGLVGLLAPQISDQACLALHRHLPDLRRSLGQHSAHLVCSGSCSL